MSVTDAQLIVLHSQHVPRVRSISLDLQQGMGRVVVWGFGGLCLGFVLGFCGGTQQAGSDGPGG